MKPGGPRREEEFEGPGFESRRLDLTSPDPKETFMLVFKLKTN